MHGGPVPISLTVDHERRRVTGVASGRVTLDEMRHYVEERVRQGAYSYPQLLDLRDAEITIPEYESMFARAMDARRELKAGEIPRSAFIARQGTATFGLLRQLATQVSFVHAAVEVFGTREEGEAWLEAGINSAM